MKLLSCRREELNVKLYQFLIIYKKKCFYELTDKSMHRKITLKWSSDSELSSIDMTSILELISNKELTQCVLECDPQKKIFRDTI